MKKMNERYSNMYFMYWDDRMKLVQKFKLLCSMVTNDGKQDAENWNIGTNSKTKWNFNIQENVVKTMKRLLNYSNI